MSETGTTRTVTVQRRRRSRLGSSNTIRQRQSGGMSLGFAQQTRAPVSFASGVIAEASQKNVAQMKSSNQQEKKQLQNLNSKLAEHFEKVHGLEAENKYLHELLNKTKVEFNVDVIKISYQEQLDDLKALLDDKDKELAAIKSEKESFLEEIEDLREQLQHLQDENNRKQIDIDGLNDEVASRIADSETSRRRTAELEKQLADWKTRNAILEGQLAELRAKLQTETTQRLELENHITMLEDEIAFNNDVHRSEVEEYQRMLSKSQKLPNFKETWKSDMGAIVADLSAEYEERLQAITLEMESRHEQQMQQLRAGHKPGGAVQQVSSEGRVSRMAESDMAATASRYENEIKSLRAKIAALEGELERSQNQHASEVAGLNLEMTSLRAELEAMLKELQDLMDTKLSMELEIAAYRKLLEGEENRLSFGSFVRTGGEFQSESESALAGALGFGKKMTMSRSRSGNVDILELQTEGKYIEIEDVAKFTKGVTNIKNWTLTQTLDNGKSFTHIFTDGNVFSGGKTIKIWGSKYGTGQGGVSSNSVTEWGAMTMPSVITLKDDKNKESAILTIKMNN